MQAEGEIHNLAQAFYAVCTEADKEKRAISEMIIYETEREKGFLGKLFKVLDEVIEGPNTAQNEAIGQAVFAHLNRYLEKQFKLGNDFPRESRMDLYTTMISRIDIEAKRKLLSHRKMTILVESLSLMLSAQCNTSLSLDLLSQTSRSLKEAPNNFCTCCYYLLALVGVINKNQPLASRIYNRCFDTLVMYFSQIMKHFDKFALCRLLQVFLGMLSNMEARRYLPIWTQIFNNNQFLVNLSQAVEVADADVQTVAINILAILFQVQNTNKSNRDRFREMKKQAGPKCIVNLVNMLNNLDMNLRTLEEKELQIVSSYLRLLTCVVDAYHLELYIDMKATLLFDIALPCLLPSKHMIIDNPEEYINRQEDLSHGQKSQTVGCYAAKLLQVICQDIDGMMTFVMNWAVSQINCEAGKAEGLFLRLSNPEERIECALLVGCIMAYRLSSRQDLIPKIENAFVNNYCLLNDPNKPATYVQSCLFFVYNMDLLFKEHVFLLKILENRLMVAASTDLHEVCRLIACNSIKDFAVYQKYAPIFKDHMTVIVKQLLKIVGTSLVSQIFQVIKGIFKLYSNDVSQQPHIVQDCINTINEHMKSSQNTAFILAVLNWVEQLLSDSKFIRYDHVKIIETLVLRFRQPSSPYTDRLIALTNLYVKQTDNVPAFISVYLSRLPQLLVSHQNSQKQLLIMCNLAINYSTQNEHIQAITSFCVQNIFSRIEIGGTETNPFTCLLILHTLLCQKFNSINSDVLKYVLKTVAQCVQYKYVRRKADTYCLYLLILLEFLKNSVPSTRAFLQSMSCYEQIMSILYEDARVYERNIPAKISILVQLAILMNGELQQIYVEKSIKIVLFLLRSRCQKKKDEEESEPDFASEDDDQQLIVPTDVDALYETLETPYKQLDDVVAFQNFIMLIRQKCEENYQYLMKMLPIGLKLFADDVMRMKKVRLEDGRTEMRKILRVNKQLI